MKDKKELWLIRNKQTERRKRTMIYEVCKKGKKKEERELWLMKNTE